MRSDRPETPQAPLDSAAQRGVVGWLALTLQHRTGALDGRRVQFDGAANGGVRVSWHGGPTASVLAEKLLALPDPDLPVEAASVPQWRRDNPLMAEVLIDGIPVHLHAFNPSTDYPAPLRTVARWRWPDAMATDGHAVDSVLWEKPRDAGTAMTAVVVRLPADVRDELFWTESATSVVNTEYRFPDTAPHDQQHAWHHARAHATVVLRTAAKDWSVADADAWIEQTVADHATRYPSMVTAVVFLDRCVLHLHARIQRTGLRIEAVGDGNISGYWSEHLYSMIPSVLLHTDLFTGPEDVPDELQVRAFGDGFRTLRVALHTTAIALARA